MADTDRIEVVLAKCEKCGNEQKIIVPHPHVPTCSKCGKRIYDGPNKTVMPRGRQ